MERDRGTRSDGGGRGGSRERGECCPREEHRRVGERVVQGRDRLLADRPAGRLRRRVHPGAPLRARVRDQGHDEGERSADRADARGRRHRSDQGRVGSEGPDRPGLQDHRRHRLVGRRAPAGPARRAEQDPLHLGAGRLGCDHRDQQAHVPVGSPDLPGRQDRGHVPPGRRQEGHRLRAGLGVRGGQLRRRERDRRLAGPQRRQAARAALGAGLHPLRPAGEAGESRPALHRLGREHGARDVPGTDPAGRLRRLEQDRHRARRAGDLVGVRRGGDADRLPLALRLHGPQEQGQRLPRQVDAEAEPGAGSLHPGRLRRRPDDRPGALGREGRRRGQDDRRARGLELRRPEGPADRPCLGSRDDPADVPGQARPERERSSVRR